MKNSIRANQDTYLKKSAFFLILFLSLECLGQNNPWAVKTTKNPWSTNSPSHQTVQKDTIHTNIAADTIRNPDQKPTVESETDYSSVEDITDSIAPAQAKNDMSEDQLITVNGIRAAKSYHTYIGFTTSFLSGAVFNLLSFPVVGLSNTVPTPRETETLEKYKEENPSASRQDIKKVKRKIRGKRTLSSIGGNALGIMTSFFIWTRLF